MHLLVIGWLSRAGHFSLPNASLVLAYLPDSRNNARKRLEALLDYVVSTRSWQCN